MHRLFECLIVTILCRISNGFLCFRNDSFCFSSKNFSVKQLEEIFQREKLMEKLYCGGTIEFNVVSKELTIEFNVDAFSLNVMGRRTINVETTFVIEKLSIRNKVKFLCANRDRCDYFLILEQFEQILLLNYTTLINTLRPSIVDRKEKRSKKTKKTIWRWILTFFFLFVFETNVRSATI